MDKPRDARRIIEMTALAAAELVIVQDNEGCLGLPEHVGIEVILFDADRGVNLLKHRIVETKKGAARGEVQGS